MTTIEHPVEPTVDEQTAVDPAPGRANGWQPTACILCECNCGIEVRLGGDDGRRFERIRGDKAHPASQGYTCEKALRLDHYQNGRHRLTQPAAPARRRHVRGDRLGHRDRRGRRALRRGARRARRRVDLLLRRRRPGEPPRRRLQRRRPCGPSAPRYRSNALAQEKTGEFWVNGQAARRRWSAATSSTPRSRVFVGKNPWQSHGFPRARTTLKEIARDPERGR